MNQLSHATDEVLVRMYTNGCNEAFDVLLDRYKTRLYDYICYQLGLRQDADADDIFQETFVRAIVTLKSNRYNHDGHFLPWLTRIAHNLIADLYRRELPLTSTTGEDGDSDLLNDAQLVETYHEAELINEQTLIDVKRLMMQLPELQREVVQMRFYEGLSFKEIAGRTGVSINTSLGRMRYALNNMRRMAENYDISLELI